MSDAEKETSEMVVEIVLVDVQSFVGLLCGGPFVSEQPTSSTGVYKTSLLMMKGLH